MPTNPNKEDKQARIGIDKIISLLKENETLEYGSLLKEVLITYEVSEGMVKRFLDNCYVATNVISIEDGIITKKHTK